jgi:hypothetical protein
LQDKKYEVEEYPISLIQTKKSPGRSNEDVKLSPRSMQQKVSFVDV